MKNRKLVLIRNGTETDNETRHREIRRRYYRIYKSTGRVYSEKFGNYIHLTPEGWKHFVHRGKGSKRPEEEQEERMSLLPKAIEIMKTGPISHGAPEMGRKSSEYWKFKDEKGTIVIVRRAPGREMHFLSIQPNTLVR